MGGSVGAYPHLLGSYAVGWHSFSHFPPHFSPKTFFFHPLIGQTPETKTLPVTSLK